jgi:hypothetical protein
MLPSRWADALVRWSAVAAVVVVSYPAVASLGELNQSRDTVLKEVGHWIAGGYNSQGVVLMGMNGTIAYYAGAVQRFLPHAPEPLALRYLHLRDPPLILLSTDDMRAPYIEKWFAAGIPDRCARLVGSLEPEPRRVFQLWQWSCGS